MFSLICVWIYDWVNSGGAGDLRRYRAHYDVIVMQSFANELHERSHESAVVSQYVYDIVSLGTSSEGGNWSFCNNTVGVNIYCVSQHPWAPGWRPRWGTLCPIGNEVLFNSQPHSSESNNAIISISNEVTMLLSFEIRTYDFKWDQPYSKLNGTFSVVIHGLWTEDWWWVQIIIGAPLQTWINLNPSMDK